MLVKSVLVRPQGLRPRTRAPTCLSPSCYATDDVGSLILHQICYLLDWLE